MPNNWKKYKLIDIINLIGGGTPKTSVPEYWNGDIPWLSVVDFNNGQKRVYDTEKKITELGLKNSSTKILKKGQLIISARGTVGVLSELGRDMSFNQSCYGLDAKKEFTTNDFLYYLVEHNIKQIKSNAYGSVFDTITTSTFENIDITLPTLPEQQAIAEILSSLDDKIELNLQTNKTLEEMANALYKHWFVDFGPFQKGKFIESELGLIPEGWEVKKIGEIFKTTYGTFIIDTEEKITDDALKNSSAKLFPPKSVLLAMYGATVGEVGIISNEATCNQAICCILPNEISYTYIFQYLKNNKQNILNNTVGSAQQNISQEIIKEFPIIFPSGIEVKSVFKRIESLFEQIELNVIENISLKQTRDYLLPKLISGEIRVKDAAKKVKEVL